VNWNLVASHLPEVCWKVREYGKLNRCLLPSSFRHSRSAFWTLPSRSRAKDGEGYYTGYVAAVNDVAGLQEKEEDGCEVIHNTPGIFERMQQSLMIRVALCGRRGTAIEILVKTAICNAGISDL
jgi:hypothetical protein